MRKFLAVLIAIGVTWSVQDAQAANEPRVKQLVAEGTNVCALFETGMVACFGQTFVSVLGEVGSIVKIKMPGGLGAKQISMGSDGVGCAILSDDTIACWADTRSLFGQRSTSANFFLKPDRAERITFGPILGKLVQVVSSEQHSCAVFATGEVSCWGLFDNKTVPPTPLIKLPAGLKAKRISTSPFHTCLISTDDQIYCWGDNKRGQLGFPVDEEDRTNNFYSKPTRPALVGKNLGAFQISTSGYATCALLAPRVNGRLLKASAVAKCWGANFSAQLGTGDASGIKSAEDFAGMKPIALPAGVIPAQIATSESQTCIVSNYGLLFCWGLNNSAMISFRPDEQFIGDKPEDMGDGLEPINLSNLARAQQVQSTKSAICVLLKSGQVKCWGFPEALTPPGYNAIYIKHVDRELTSIDFSQLFKRAK
jgi:alpha-tubulin suppressor-like RCC1 family protein